MGVCVATRVPTHPSARPNVSMLVCACGARMSNDDYGDYVSIAGRPGRGEMGAVSMLGCPAPRGGFQGRHDLVTCSSDVVRPPPPPSRRAGSLELTLQMFHSGGPAPNWRSALRCGAPPPPPPLPRDRFPSIARMRCRFAGAGSAAAADEPAARWSASPAWRYEVH